MTNAADEAPSWIGVGKKLHWWSESQKKNMLVIVTFEVDQKVWKEVPFSQIGKKDCPLRNPKQGSGKNAEANAPPPPPGPPCSCGAASVGLIVTNEGLNKGRP